VSTDAGPLERGLRVLAADEDEAALRQTAELLGAMGHRVTSLAVDVRAAGERIASEDPDLAVVVVHRDDAHALALIDEISSYASGPVIALLEEEDAEFVRDAAERGVAAYARTDSPEALQSAIELAMRRHADEAKLAEQVGQLEGALDRRGVIERAKGILMERHQVDERAAFELLRRHARGHNRTVVDTARAVLEGHALLPGRRDAP
jgi:AmiR/NasT family two-component response regulator